MNRCVELHDSDVAAASIRGNVLELLFDRAYVHQSEGRPGIDPGTGWTQRLLVSVQNAALDHSIPPLPDRISDGILRVGSTRYDNELPLPLRIEEAIRLELVMADSGLPLTVSGTAIEVQELDSPRYVEQFP